jgi:hypothetical protein
VRAGTPKSGLHNRPAGCGAAEAYASGPGSEEVKLRVCESAGKHGHLKKIEKRCANNGTQVYKKIRIFTGYKYNFKKNVKFKIDSKMR